MLRPASGYANWDRTIEADTVNERRIVMAKRQDVLAKFTKNWSLIRTIDWGDTNSWEETPKDDTHWTRKNTTGPHSPTTIKITFSDGTTQTDKIPADGIVERRGDEIRLPG